VNGNSEGETDDKERLIDELSARLDALEKGGTDWRFDPAAERERNTRAKRKRSVSSSHGSTKLTEQLEAEKQKNRTLKGA